MSRTLQLTLALLKPDVTSRPHMVTEIKSLIINKGFLFVRSKQLTLSHAEAINFYKEHEGKFFHNRLVSFMSSGPISAHILAKEDAIVHWRRLMGPTKVFKTIHDEPDSIRGKFGLTDTRNATHGSDSEDNALEEMKFFFPEFDVSKWYKDDEMAFRERRVDFCENTDVHVMTDKISVSGTQN